MTPSPQKSPVPATQPRLDRRLRLAAFCVAITFVVTALMLSAAPAGASSTATNFTITGHGWGHGIGLSQWGAYGYARHGWKYKAILRHYYSGVSFGAKLANKIIRVNLRSGLSSVKVTCPYPYSVRGTGSAVQIPAGTSATTTYVGSKYHVVAGSVTRDFSASVRFTPSKGALRILTKTDLGDTGAYRGRIRVLRTGGALMMINELRLESYLRGVVPHEVPASWPTEALKTQACAARAYAEASRNSSAAWDVYCDVRDQAYMGVGIESKRTDHAIAATAGVVPRYGGKVITAYYSSCSGGHTESIQYAWPGASAVAYLKGVKDPYDYYATLHTWGPISRTASKLASLLGSAVKGSLRAVYRVKHGTSPRIVKAAIIGSSGTTFMDGNTLRTKASLNSTWAVFTSMSINPSPGDKPTIAAGTAMTLKGRIYPALAAGSTVTLHYYHDGKWRSRKVSTTRHSQSLGSGYTAVYSSYSDGIAPKQTTQYYFSSGKAKSPTLTVTTN